MQTYHFESDAGVGGLHRWSSSLASIRDAQVEAVRSLGELLRDDGTEFWASEPVSMTVSDEGGLILFRLQLSAVLAPAMSGALN